MMIKEEAAEDISGGGRRLPRRTVAAGKSTLDGRRKTEACARAQPRWKKQEQQSKGLRGSRGGGG